MAASATQRSETGSDAEAASSSRPSSPIPRALGRYRILDELASGGMATLYLAATSGPAGYEKMVALKRIHPHLAKERRFLDMFLDEARLAARIVHPNVCGVIDFGEADGQHFLAMDFLSGVPLSELMRAVGRSAELRADPMWVPVIGRILRDAAEGLHAAHELRDADGRRLEVVHRDVSPQNIFVGFDGTTRVIDFGVAAAADRIHHTATGEVKGKFAYMAPEQVNHDTPDRRIDVWALGVVAWEALTLKRLFRREGTAATLYAVLEEPIEAPSALSPRLPEALDAPILHALRRERDERTPSTRELGDAIRVAIEARGARLAEPGEVADLLRRALPREEESLRTRIISARARKDQLETPRSALPASWPLVLAMICLVVLGALAGAWGLGTLASGDESASGAREPGPTLVPEPTAPRAAPPPATTSDDPTSAHATPGSDGTFASDGTTSTEAVEPPAGPTRSSRRHTSRPATRGGSEGPDLATEW
ncbi:MAG: serine/threonine protein kinase [Sandaracinaceae bacterium]|nr:serine/threonine protein kinase [Sandaracinaceae bacterium]